jgi:hypothetical protein
MSDNRALAFIIALRGQRYKNAHKRFYGEHNLIVTLMQIGCDASAAHNDKILIPETLALERECSSTNTRRIITARRDAVVCPRAAEKKETRRRRALQRAHKLWV